MVIRSSISALRSRDGKYHAVDSSDFAFHTAGKAAVKDAMDEAGTRVLQPIRRIRIDVPTVYFRRAGAADLRPFTARFSASATTRTPPGGTFSKHSCPNQRKPNCSMSLGANTRGTAWYTSELERYEEMH